MFVGARRCRARRGPRRRTHSRGAAPLRLRPQAPVSHGLPGASREGGWRQIDRRAMGMGAGDGPRRGTNGRGAALPRSQTWRCHVPEWVAVTSHSLLPNPSPPPAHITLVAIAEGAVQHIEQHGASAAFGEKRQRLAVEVEVGIFAALHLQVVE